MASDDQVNGRPRSWLLILLAVSLAALVLTRMWPTGAATSAVPAATQARQLPQRSQAGIEPGNLDVHLDALATPRPELGSTERNPFRFRPPPTPPVTEGRGSRGNGPPPPPPPPPPPSEPVVPPIPLKFIGVVEKQGLKLAAMSDCRTTYHGSEGQIIDGRYRLVSIGVESIVLEYVDGRGRTTVRQDGCSPR